MTALGELKAEIKKCADPEKAKILSRFFKTGKGQYGEGDIFLGIMVPMQRRIARKYARLPRKDIKTLLSSRVHEERLIALLILITQFQNADEDGRKGIVDFYCSQTKNINNWDLVDLSAEKILGEYLVDKDRSLIYKLARSKNLWERRIAIITTLAFIKRHSFRECLQIAEMLLTDTHDLIHKAVGWMLREVGKRDLRAEEEFLRKHYHDMPRTMLRYAIERFDEKNRRYWMER